MDSYRSLQDSCSLPQDYLSFPIHYCSLPNDSSTSPRGYYSFPIGSENVPQDSCIESICFRVDPYSFRADSSSFHKDLSCLTTEPSLPKVFCGFI